MNRPQQGFPPILDRRGPPRVRRFDEQRWLIDNIIRANGIDWDQPQDLAEVRQALPRFSEARSRGVMSDYICAETVPSALEMPVNSGLPR